MNNYSGFNPNDPANVPPAAPAPSSPNGWAIASLIFGILALVICTCCCGGSGWLPLILGAVAIIFAVISRKGGKMSGVAVGGLVCGIIAVALALAVFILGFFVFNDSFWLAYADEFITEFEASMPEGFDSSFFEEFYQYIE